MRLTQVPGLDVHAVAKGLDIHPLMLLRRRQQGRVGRLRGRSEEPRISKKLVRESKRLQESSESTSFCRRSMSPRKKSHPLHFGAKGAVFGFSSSAARRLQSEASMPLCTA